MITEIQQRTLDINWFFTNGEYIGFAASVGGRLPQSVAKSSNAVAKLNTFFSNLSRNSECVLNPELSKVLGFSPDDGYLGDFLSMTENGLFSFDKTIPGDFETTDYHLVAKPVTPLKLSQLPEELAQVILKTRYDGEMPLGFSSDEIS